MNQNKAQANTKLVKRHVGGLVAAYPMVSSSFLDKTYENSLPTNRFGKILLQPTPSKTYWSVVICGIKEMKNPSNSTNKIVPHNTNLHVS